MMQRRWIDYLERRIRKIIRMKKEDVEKKKIDILRLHYFYDRRKKTPFRIFWLIILGINFSLLFYQLYDRVEYYLSEPTTFITKFENTVKLDALPNFIIHSLVTSRSIKKFPNCPFLNEIKSEEIDGRNSSELWELYDNADDIVFVYDNETLKENLSLTKVPNYYGISNSFTIGNQKDDFLKHFKIRLKHFPQCSVKPSVQLSYILLSKHGLVAVDSIQVDGEQQWHIVFRKLTQLQYVNTKRNPCVDEETYEECFNNCRINKLLSYNYSCRYPCHPIYKALPFCLLWDSYRYCIDVEVTQEECNCTQKCTELLIKTQKYLIRTSPNWTEITFETPHIEIFVELLAYNQINLACDIGGLFGLYFGWSVLSITNLFMEWLQRRNEIKPSIKLVTRDLIKEKVMKIFHEEQQRKESERKSFKKLFHRQIFRNIFNGMKEYVRFVIVLFFITFPLLGNCVYNQFYSVPILLKIDVQRNKILRGPDITVCTQSDNITVLKNEFSKQNSGTCEFTLLDLVNKELLNNTYSLSELWRRSYYQFNTVGKIPDNAKLLEMQNGMCTTMTFRSFDPYGTDSFDFYIYKLNTNCTAVTKIYFLSVDDMEDVVLEVEETLGFTTVTSFLKKYKYLNTGGNPCTDNISHIKCKEKCKTSSIEKLTCRLPYMPNLKTIPDCITTETAYNSHLQYIKNMDKCVCRRKCILEKYEFLFDNVFNSKGLMVTIGETSTTVITIEEMFSYPFTKLLADIGNILGITVAISIMSLILSLLDQMNLVHN